MISLELQINQFLGCLLPGLSPTGQASHEHLFKYADSRKREELTQIFITFKSFVSARTGNTLMESSDIEILNCWKDFAVENRREYLQLSSSLLQGYYADPKVLQNLGLRHTTSFPLGIKVHQGDLSMLEPVYNRGQIFRC